MESSQIKSTGGSSFTQKPSLKLIKNELRKKYLALRRDIKAEQKHDLDAAICRKITSTASYRYSDILLVYSALEDEVSLNELVFDALRQGKRVAFPRCIPNSFSMEFHFVESIDQLEKGSYSISEPPKDAPIWIPNDGEKALCIIPGVVFDRHGHRIGYGKGYYDRYLCDKNIQRIGVAYSCLVVDELPHGRYDLAMDLVVSEKQMISILK